ncbi:MAG TPA: hypothetical protein VFN10_22380 [Thermoanaerobaculia bacterium]|nr:hypothetical protein [Thermoanaerobaculia bacterium]
MKRATIAILCFALCSAANAQQRLREGLIIDGARNTAYVMTPNGGIAAVNLLTGNVQWKSETAAKPLGLVGTRLVSQVEPKTAAEVNMLTIAVLDVQQRGAMITRKAMKLPANVRAAVAGAMNGRFSAVATGSGSNAVITWTYTPIPQLRGMPELPEETLEREQAAAAPKAASKPMSGSMRMNLRSGAMSVMRNAEAARAIATPTWVIPASQIDASPATQYESADGRHILTSERVADDPEWNRYQWTITDRATGQRVGQFRNHISFSPFVVRDSIIAYETTPYMHEGDEQPAKLRGVDLRTGREVWSVEVRELVYRGPTPP